MSSTTHTAELRTLKVKELKARIAELTGQSLKSNNRPYLIRKLAAALEAKAAEEAKTRKTKAKKARATRQAKASEQAPPRRKRARRADGERDPRLPAPGTVLARDYQGKTIQVQVLEEGFAYEGETYRSLSTIAREATGTIWNGFVFFRLAPYPKRDQAAA